MVCSSFIQKINNNLNPTERALFPCLHVLFDQDSKTWSDEQYEAFVDSVKPNFSGSYWEYLGYVFQPSNWP
jgi:hypothetical protein